MYTKSDKGLFKQQKEKELLKVVSELRSLYRTPIEYEEIEPYHHGYFKILVIREAIEGTKKGAIAHRLLSLCNNKYWFRDKKASKKKSKFSYIKDIHSDLHPSPLNEAMFNAIDEDLKEFFVKKIYKPIFSSVSYNIYVIEDSKQFFDQKVVKCWVTKQKKVNPERESRIAYLDNWMTANNGWKKFHKIKSVKHHSVNDKEKIYEIKNPIHTEDFFECDDDINQYTKQDSDFERIDE